MTKMISLFIAILVLAIGNLGQAAVRGLKPSHREVNSKSSLLERHKEFIAATAKGKAEAMARLVTDDYTVTGADGQLADKAKALRAVRGNGTGVEMSESEVNARLVDGAGVVTGLIKWKAGTAGSEVNGRVRYTEVWRRGKKGRELVAAQATNVQER